jgi:hypothetical protein
MANYKEIKSSTRKNIIFWLLFLGVVHVILDPIGYFKTNYYDVRKLELPGYLEKVQDIRTEYELNYIGHQKIDKDIEKEINKMKSSFLEFFKSNSLGKRQINPTLRKDGVMF